MSTSQPAKTPVYKHVLRQARNECGRLGHDEIKTEHLLLALIRDGGLAHFALSSVVDLFDFKLQIEQSLPTGKQPTVGIFPLTPSLKRTIKKAEQIARDRDHTWIGPEHLLLASFPQKQQPEAYKAIDNYIREKIASGFHPTNVQSSLDPDAPDQLIAQAYARAVEKSPSKHTRKKPAALIQIGSGQMGLYIFKTQTGDAYLAFRQLENPSHKIGSASEICRNLKTLEQIFDDAIAIIKVTKKESLDVLIEQLLKARALFDSKGDGPQTHQQRRQYYTTYLHEIADHCDQFYNLEKPQP